MPNTPINNLIVQNAGVAQTGLLMGNGTSPVSAAIAANVSAALDLIGGTQGNVLYRSATGWTVLAPGTAGYVLTAAGAGADPAWAAVSGTGDVVGPASATDNALARFDTTTGKLIKNSVVIVDNSGNMTSPGGAVLNTVNTGGRVGFTYQIDSGQYYPGIWFGAAVTTPSFTNYSFLASPTEIFFNAQATGLIDFRVGDVRRMTISSAGLLRLHAYGLGALQSDASGNVTATQDIRTTATPQFAGLKVQNNSSAPGMISGIVGIYLAQADAALPFIQTDAFGSFGGIITRRSNGTAASPSQVLNGDSLGSWQWRGYHNGGAYTGAIVQANVFASENFTSSSQGTIWTFNKTTTGTSSAAEIIRFSASNNLLVGLTADTGLTGSGNIGCSNAIITGSPTGSTARPFKVGSATAAVSPVADTVVRVEINGVPFDLLARA